MSRRLTFLEQYHGSGEKEQTIGAVAEHALVDAAVDFISDVYSQKQWDDGIRTHKPSI